MTDIIPINLAVEDVLSEEVITCIIEQSGRSFAIGTCYRRSGSGYLRKTIGGFNNAAKGTPFLVLTDLDNHECPPDLIRDWLPIPKHDNLIFRVAVREVEAWLLAHRGAFSEFLGISNDLVPISPDEEPDPKQCLINLARRSRKTALRRAIVPKDGSTAKIGPDYNGKLIGFLNNHWNVQEAAQNSPSLERALQSICNFAPVYQ
jgi:hypothetical protein